MFTDIFTLMVSMDKVWKAQDHHVPDGISIANYRHYVNPGHERPGLPPVSSDEHRVMAF